LIGGILRVKGLVQEVLCPPCCVICQKILPIGKMICYECRQKLPLTGSVVCMKCGKPIDGENDELCRDCRNTEHYFDRNIALWTYSPQLKQSIYRFKYGNKRYYGKFYAEEIMRRYARLIKLWGVDAIVPIPLFKGKLRARGYNQAAIIANELGRISKIAVRDDIVVRVRNTIPMKELNDKERRKNIKGSFKITKSMIQLNKILLLDDIFTTGSTVDEVSKVLKTYGVKSVYALTLCVGRGY